MYHQVTENKQEQKEHEHTKKEALWHTIKNFYLPHVGVKNVGVWIFNNNAIVLRCLLGQINFLSFLILSTPQDDEDRRDKDHHDEVRHTKPVSQLAGSKAHSELVSGRNYACLG